MILINKIKQGVYYCRKSYALLYELVKKREKYIYAESFYPECDRKRIKTIWYEQMRHVFKYGQINAQYFEYGIDRVGINDDDYLDLRQYMYRRDKSNDAKPYNTLCLVRNKKLFAIYGKYYGFPVWDSIGVMQKGVIIEDNGAKHEIIDILKTHKNIFIKPIDGKKGSGIFRIQYDESTYSLNYKTIEVEELCKTLKEASLSDSYLVQDLFIQNKILSTLYDKSVNTLRIVTVNPKHSENVNDVVLVAAILRIGANGSVVDSHSQGGLEVAVNKDGKLDKYAYYKPGFGTKVVSHPNSGVIFEGYQLPFYNEAVEVCRSFHAKLNKLHHIGWDVIFSEKGVHLFEANDSTGTMLQTFLGPLREQYKTWLPE